MIKEVLNGLPIVVRFVVFSPPSIPLVVSIAVVVDNIVFFPGIVSLLVEQYASEKQ